MMAGRQHQSSAVLVVVHLIVFIQTAAIMAVAGQQNPPIPSAWLNMVTFKEGAGLPRIGSILVADALSLYSKGKKRNSATCKQLAMRLQGANAWAICEKDGGCGTGCAEYTQTNPPLPKDKSTVGKTYWSLALPVKGVGYWTWPSFGLSGCALDAMGKPTDKWSSGTCRILKIKSPRKPSLLLPTDTAGTGWQYGTIIRDGTKCYNTLSSTCAACQKTPFPARCTAAASKYFAVEAANALKAMLAPNLEEQAAQQVAVVRCVNQKTASVRSICLNYCVLGKRPCNQCVFTRWSPEQPPPKLPYIVDCLNCAWDYKLGNLALFKLYSPKSFARLRSDVCRECASRPYKARIKCAPCLQKAAKSMCPHDNSGDPSYTAYQQKFGPCQSPTKVLAQCDAAASAG